MTLGVCVVHLFSKFPYLCYRTPNILSMFSGIIEEAASVVKLEKERDNLHITMKCSFVNELKIDQSISHNGVCLTVVKKEEGAYTVTAIKETTFGDVFFESILNIGDRKKATTLVIPNIKPAFITA